MPALPGRRGSRLAHLKRRDPFAGVAARDEVNPLTSLANTEVAVRAYRRVGGLGLQYYAELMLNHAGYRSSLPAGLPAQGRYRDTVTVRLTQLLKHQTRRLSLFAFVSPADADYLLIPEVSYRLSDRLSATVGANVFGGQRDTTFLGQFDRNDNAYAALRFDF